MIDQADQNLKLWVESIVGPHMVTLAPPKANAAGQGVSLYLIELASTPPPRTAKRPPLQFTLRYLVTTWAEEPETAHRLLGQLAFAALESAEFEVEPEPVPLAVWTALAVPPQASFVLRAPLRLARPEPAIKLVRAPLVVQTTPLTSFFGRLLGPNNIPIANARIEFPALNRVTHTDRSGSFYFTALPSEPRTKTLHIRVKAWELRVTTDQTTSELEPFIIRFDPQEE